MTLGEITEPATVIRRTLENGTYRSLVILEGTFGDNDVHHYAIDFEEVLDGYWTVLEVVRAVIPTEDEAHKMAGEFQEEYRDEIERVIRIGEMKIANGGGFEEASLVLRLCPFGDSPVMIGIAKKAGLAGVASIERCNPVMDINAVTLYVGNHRIWIFSFKDREDEWLRWVQAIPFLMTKKICEAGNLAENCHQMLMESYQDEDFSVRVGATESGNRQTIDFSLSDDAFSVTLQEGGEAQPHQFDFDVKEAVIKNNVLSIYLAPRDNYFPKIVFDIIDSRMKLRDVMLLQPEMIATHLGLEGKLKDAFMKQETFVCDTFSIQSRVKHGEDGDTFVLTRIVNNEKFDMALQKPATVISTDIDSERRSLVILEGTHGITSYYFAINFKEEGNGDWTVLEVANAVIPDDDEAGKMAGDVSEEDRDQIKRVFQSGKIKIGNGGEFEASLVFLRCTFVDSPAMMIGIDKKAGLGGVVAIKRCEHVGVSLLVTVYVGDHPIFITVPEDGELSWQYVVPSLMATALSGVGPFDENCRQMLMMSYQNIDFRRNTDSNTSLADEHQHPITFYVEKGKIMVSIERENEKALSFNFDVETMVSKDDALHISLKRQGKYCPMIVFDIVRSRTNLKLNRFMLIDVHEQVARAVLGNVDVKGNVEYISLYMTLRECFNTFESDDGVVYELIISKRGELMVHRSDVKGTTGKWFTVKGGASWSMARGLPAKFVLPHAEGKIELDIDGATLKLLKHTCSETP
eukprot:GHVS01058555.1.p1 GENE.GHVS01058555.1~~GHVS01058555.1.p1  ORF type:complete len:746 (+),score=69.39 GHVS01058555.1:383-2620(+)